MHLTIPKISKSVSINDWWITFDEERQGMVGYACLPNDNQQQVEQGFPFKNMLFIYVKPQWRANQVFKGDKPMVNVFWNSEYFNFSSFRRI